MNCQHAGKTSARHSQGMNVDDGGKTIVISSGENKDFLTVSYDECPLVAIDLAIAFMKYPSNPIAVGQPITLNLGVSNTGNDASSVFLSVVFEHTATVSGFPSFCAATHNAVTCNIGAVAKGNTVPVSFELVAPFVREIAIHASVWSSLFSDSTPSNNTRSNVIQVRPRPFVRSR